MGQFFSSVASSDSTADETVHQNIRVDPNLLAASKLGQQTEARWSLQQLKTKMHPEILDKGVSPIEVFVADIAEGHDASIVKFRAEPSLITNTESGEYNLHFPTGIDAVRAIYFPEGVRNLKLTGVSEEVLRGSGNLSFDSAWGLLSNPARNYLLTFEYPEDLAVSAPLSENIVFEVVHYSEDIRSSIHNFLTIRSF